MGLRPPPARTMRRRNGSRVGRPDDLSKKLPPLIFSRRYGTSEPRTHLQVGAVLRDTFGEAALVAETRVITFAAENLETGGDFADPFVEWSREPPVAARLFAGRLTISSPFEIQPTLTDDAVARVMRSNDVADWHEVSSAADWKIPRRASRGRPGGRYRSFRTGGPGGSLRWCRRPPALPPPRGRRLCSRSRAARGVRPA
jgi:hypothetical protein